MGDGSRIAMALTPARPVAHPLPRAQGRLPAHTSSSRPATCCVLPLPPLRPFALSSASGRPFFALESRDPDVLSFLARLLLHRPSRLPPWILARSRPNKMMRSPLPCFLVAFFALLVGRGRFLFCSVETACWRGGWIDPLC